MSKNHKSQNSSVTDSHNPQRHDAESHDTDRQRRNFLRNSISTAVGVAVSAAAIQTVASVTGSVTGSAGETDGALQTDKKEGYRLTKHIADYYRSAAV